MRAGAKQLLSNDCFLGPLRRTSSITPRLMRKEIFESYSRCWQVSVVVYRLSVFYHTFLYLLLYMCSPCHLSYLFGFCIWVFARWQRIGLFRSIVNESFLCGTPGPSLGRVTLSSWSIVFIRMWLLGWCLYPMLRIVRRVMAWTPSFCTYSPPPTITFGSHFLLK